MLVKSLALIPYCPFPADSGGKVEMWKHLDLLQSMGECTLVSAATRPVGMGWTASTKKKAEELGYAVRLREELFPNRNWKQLAGLAYGAICKGLRLERAFGHTNPYHRHAFPPKFLLECSRQADLAVINYSYWASLPTHCPKVIILHDLLSHVMWGDIQREIEDLRTADLIIVISKDEEVQLRQQGLQNILWSPPLAEPSDFPLTSRVGITGSANTFNQEGLRWLSKAAVPEGVPVKIYGALAQFAQWPEVDTVGRYEDSHEPYRDCGVFMLPTTLGMGVQIKTVEALAAGRAIVARTGAMRGLPPGEGAWIEVDTPESMWEQATLFSRNAVLREEQGARARAYYRKNLDYRKILSDLREAYSSLVRS
ncbi:MAG: glycosyltransferase family 1 protein [Candidatus Electrothrix sp. ATG1]|nr:glycosyltransferase family 1 protein [Candidatus Electrothrix sp. ATG1]